MTMTGEFVLKLPKSIYRVQRRKHFRLPVEIDKQISVVFRFEGKIHKFPVADISAGGFACYTKFSKKELLPEDEKEEEPDSIQAEGEVSKGVEVVDQEEELVEHKINILMPDKRTIPVSVYIRFVSTFISKRYKTKVGVEFTYIDEEDLEYLTEYIIEEQKRIARKKNMDE